MPQDPVCFSGTIASSASTRSTRVRCRASSPRSTASSADVWKNALRIDFNRRAFDPEERADQARQRRHRSAGSAARNRGDRVATVRADEKRRLGEELATEAPADADVVIPVPDSGMYAALGIPREDKMARLQWFASNGMQQQKVSIDSALDLSFLK